MSLIAHIWLLCLLAAVRLGKTDHGQVPHREPQSQESYLVRLSCKRDDLVHYV